MGNNDLTIGANLATFEKSDELLHETKEQQLLVKARSRIIGYNLGAESIKLGDRFHEVKEQQLLEKTAKNDEIVAKLRVLNAFRRELERQRQEGGKEINFDTPELRHFADELRQEIPGIIDEGRYKWKNSEEPMNRLDARLMEEAKHVSTPFLNINLLELQHDFELRNRIWEIIGNIVQHYDTGNDTIVRNSSRS